MGVPKLPSQQEQIVLRVKMSNANKTHLITIHVNEWFRITKNQGECCFIRRLHNITNF